MAYKQPRVPPMNEGVKIYDYIRSLVLFLKDFCLETWAENRNIRNELSEIRKELDAVKDEIADGAP